jgi:hypothetical protein
MRKHSVKEHKQVWQKGPGWARDSYGKELYHFEHIPLSDAEAMKEIKGLLHVVETVNWTLHDRKTVHLNKYFAYGLPAALSLAVEIELGSQEVAEEVIGIRIVDETEADEFIKQTEAQDHPTADNGILVQVEPQTRMPKMFTVEVTGPKSKAAKKAK